MCLSVYVCVYWVGCFFLCLWNGLLCILFFFFSFLFSVITYYISKLNAFHFKPVFPLVKFFNLFLFRFCFWFWFALNFLLQYCSVKRAYVVCESECNVLFCFSPWSERYYEYFVFTPVRVCERLFGCVCVYVWMQEMHIRRSRSSEALHALTTLLNGCHFVSLYERRLTVLLTAAPSVLHTQRRRVDLSLFFFFF